MEENSDGINDGKVYAKVKAQLDQIEQYKREGARIRARSRRIENNERISKAIYGIERTRAKAQQITALKVEETEYVDLNGIMDAIGNYYQELYTQEVTYCPSAVFTLTEPDIAKVENETLKGPITSEEVMRAIKRAPNGKSPGSDGLVVEFYKTFKNKIVRLLTSVLNKCVNQGVLAPSMRVAIITLIGKTDDVEKKKQLANWRPISLLNSDYKIYASILAERLKRVIDHVISPNQVCGIPGRTIIDHLCTMRLIADSCEQGYMDTIWYNLDIQKAFDRVDRDHLWNVMYEMGFHEEYVNMVKSLYNGNMSIVYCNGAYTKEIYPTRSIRQGCPMSGLLFAVYLEPLIRKIQNDSAIRGFLPPDRSKEEIKILGYADDVYIIVADTQSFLRADEIVNRFCHVTNCKINKEKCKGMLWGDWSPGVTRLKDINWQENAMKVLGVIIAKPQHLYRSAKEYWLQFIQRIEEGTRKWSNKSISIMARAKVWNSVLLAPMWYQMPWLPIPNYIVTKIERIGALFVWNHTSTEFCRRTTLKNPIELGGLSMTDIKCKVASIYVKYLHTVVNKTKIWQPIAKAMLVSYFPEIGPHVGAVVGASLTPMHIILRRVLDHFEGLGLLEILHQGAWKTPYRQMIEREISKPIATVEKGKVVTEAVRAILKSKTEPGIKTTGWKIVHDCLPVGQWLRRRRIGAQQTAGCPFGCDEEEDLCHLLMNCKNAKELWEYIQIHQKFAPPEMDQRRFPTRPAHADTEMATIMTANHVLWLVRNRYVFEKRKISPIQMYNEVRERLERMWCGHVS